jgi:hypothetical protein
LVTIRFDLTSFADKIYQWRETSERRNSVARRSFYGAVAHDF